MTQDVGRLDGQTRGGEQVFPPIIRSFQVKYIASKEVFWYEQAAQRISCPPVTLIAWPVM